MGQRRSSGRGHGDAGEVVWCWLRDDFGMSCVALYVDCVWLDDITNVVWSVSLSGGVTSNVTILLGG